MEISPIVSVDLVGKTIIYYTYLYYNKISHYEVKTIYTYI